MREKHFVIRNNSEGLAVARAITAYFAAGKARPLSIKMKMKRNTRSLEQNSKIHAMINEFASDIGDNSEAVKEELLTRFSPKVVSQFKDKNGFKNLVRPKRTSEMSTVEMAEFITQVEVLMIEYGVFGHHANERYS